jgi:hypothetical protein
VLSGFEYPSALDAIGAGFDLAVHAAHKGMNDLQVRFEQPWRNGGHVLANATLLLGLTATQDAVSADPALATYFTASRHD